MTWAPGGNALGGECPPAPAFGRRLLLYFAPKDIPTRVRLSRFFKGTKLEASLFRQPAIRRPGLRSRRTASHASVVGDVAPTYVGVAASSGRVDFDPPLDDRERAGRGRSGTGRVEPEGCVFQLKN